MAFVRACELPDHLAFQVEKDVWLERLDDGSVRLGMTDPAQTRAGKILHVRVRTGKEVMVGGGVASVESAKWVGPVPAPLPCRILAGNPIVLEDPNRINQDPYGDGWLLTLRPMVADAAWAEFGIVQGDAAVDAYREKLRAENLTCVRCSPPDGSGDPRKGGV